MGYWSSDDTRFALSSASVTLSTVTMRGLQGMKITDEVSGEPIYGNGQLPLGLPPGAFKGSLSFSTIPEEGDTALAALGSGWTQIPGTLAITLIEPNNSTIYDISAGGVYLRKLEADLGEAGGGKGSMFAFEGLILQPISWGGLFSVNAPSIFDVGLSQAFSIF